jgi:hypothetical protein
MAIVKHLPFCRRGHSITLVGRTPAGNCRECSKQKTLEWKFRQPKDKLSLRRRANALRLTYGLTLEDWDRLFAAQGGRCALCNRHQSELSFVLCVDHDHITGKVRGLLCRACNGALGYFEKIGAREKMHEYLAKYKETL